MIDKLKRGHANRTAGTGDQCYIGRQKRRNAEFLNGHGMAAANLHKTNRGSVVGLDFFSQNLCQIFITVFLYVFHDGMLDGKQMAALDTARNLTATAPPEVRHIAPGSTARQIPGFGGKESMASISRISSSVFSASSSLMRWRAKPL